MNEGTLGREYEDGEVICRQDEEGERMYVVQAGVVEVIREEADGKVVVGELDTGELFGEMAIFEKELRSATVRAKGKALVLSLDKRTFLKRVHQDPSLAYRMLQGMSRRIRRLDKDLARLEVEFIKIKKKAEAIKYILIVPKDQSEIYEKLTQDFSDNQYVKILLDRRGGERRNSRQSQGSEKRQADRRHIYKKLSVELIQSERNNESDTST